MVQTKLVSLAFIVLMAASCGPRFTWQRHVIDGHRTGVVASNADNVSDAFGTVSDGVYYSPDGRQFDNGSVVSVAKSMISVQPEMYNLKQVIAYSADEMVKRAPESALSNWAVDLLMDYTAKKTGKHIDVGILNFGGIRVDMPEGAVLLDDLVSMFPFNNYPTYVALKGEDLLETFEFMAKTHVQVVGGVKIVVDDHKLDTLLIGGQPLDPQKIYGVATIDFLLDGGDGLTLAKNCKDLIITGEKLQQVYLDEARRLTAEGSFIEYQTDGRAVERNNRR